MHTTQPARKPNRKPGPVPAACLPGLVPGLALLLACGLMPAIAKAAPEDGLWSGTLGNNKIMACFRHDNDPAHPQQAAYFYVRHGKLIGLLPEGQKPGLWLEGTRQNPGGWWEIKVQGESISGQWLDPAKKRPLPILLDRFNGLASNDASACDPRPETFPAALYAQALQEKISYGAPRGFDGKRYRVLSAGAVSSLELLDDAKAAAAINARLVNGLRNDLMAYYGCPSESMRQNKKPKKDEKPDFNATVKLWFWHARWVSFESSSSGDCGGAHPFSDYSYSTWDLDSGKQVNLWEWIKNSRKSDIVPGFDGNYFNYAAPEALNNLIVKRAVRQRLASNPKEASEENNCIEPIQGNREYQIRLGKTGLVFTQAFPHVILACSDNIEVSYRELAPFLSPKGKAAVMVLEAGGR